MRTHGKLIRWNDERGFGLVETAAGAREVFVHISAFPRDGSRPQIGELLSFELQSGENDRQRAVQVQRLARAVAVPARRHRSQAPRRRWGGLAALACLLAVALVGYRFVQPESAHPSETLAHPVESAEVRNLADNTPDAPQLFQCDGRTMCSQMHSCAEATFFIKQCPGAKMDGDGDGVPCESQWCP